MQKIVREQVRKALAELYFVDEQQLQATVDSPEGRTAIADFTDFATGGVTILMGLVVN